MLIKDIIHKFDKSNIKAGDGLEKGKYPLYTCSPTVNKYLDSYLCEDEALVLSTGGNFSIHYVNGKFNYSTDCYVFNTDKYNLKYLFYYLISKTEDINKMFRGAGLKHLNKNEFVLLNIKDIDFQEQQSIVEKLDNVNKLIEIKKHQIDKCDVLVKSQFVEMFGDIKHNVKGFEIIKLEDYTNMITYGLTVRPKYIECGIPLISATEIKTGDIDYKLAKKISLEDYESLSEKAKLSKGDMLFGKVGASIGYCAIVSNDEKIAITQNIARLILKDSVNKLWLKGFLTSDEIQDWCQREAKGNAMKDLQINTIRNMPIIKCDIELQNKFAQIVEQIDKQKFEFEKQLKKLEELQASLMQEYFG